MNHSRSGIGVAIMCCVLMAGCLGYRIGPVLKADYRSVAVPMFKNQTLQPQIEAQITGAILKRLQADGTLRVESEPNADIIVRGEIIRYYRHQLRSVREETGVAREYRITITSHITVQDKQTGEVIRGPTKVTGSAETFIGIDQQTAEFQALPLIADDLARQVVDLLVESW